MELTKHTSALAIILLIVISPFSTANADTDSKLISPFFSATGEFLSVIDGGNSTGSDWQSILDYGFELNLKALTSSVPGTLTIHAETIQGESPTESAGDFSGISNIDAFNTTRLFQAYYSHSTPADLEIKIGLIDIDDDFATTEAGAMFINSNYGAISILGGNNAGPIWPLGAPGLFVKKNFKTKYLQFGFFDGDLGDEIENKRGTHIENSSKEGYVLALEAGIETKILEHAGVIKIGGFHHTGKAFTHFSNGTEDSHQSSLYAVIEQPLAENTIGFSRIAYSLDDNNSTVLFYIESGLSITGIIPQRDQDILGLAISLNLFADDYMASSNALNGDETIIEGTYSIALNDNFYIQPDFQYIVRPHEGKENATIIGIRSGFEF